MSDDFHFEQVATCDTPLVDVIFIHGLTGDAYQTWGNTKEDFWPNWLQEDLEHLSVYTLGYPASLFEKWANKEMDIFERAKNVLEHFAAKGIGERPIAFVTHSLGGILTKVLLRKSCESEDEDYKFVSDSTQLVIFLATPHLGASLAKAAKVFPGSSKHIELLANETGFLEDLNGHYRSFANNKGDLSTKVYYEKHYTKKIALVVTRESADPGVAGADPTAMDKNHLNICKPEDKDDLVYLGVRRHVGKLLKNTIKILPQGNKDFLGENYLSKTDADRRDLYEKLVDANRTHEYEYANASQSSFARRYLKTGLFTPARDEHETLLSEVETRFMTHVFHPLISTGANEEKVREALQVHVIDPLTNKTIGNTVFSAKSILSAVYFLTEQCHIKWDSPI